MENSANQSKLGTKKIPVLLLTMALPLILSMVVSALYNIVDSMFIGMMPSPSNEKAITALGYAYPLQMLLVAVAIGTGIGVNSVLSKALGQGKKEEAAKSCMMGYLLMMGFFVPFFVIGLLIYFTGFYFSSVTNDAEVIEMGQRYLGLCFIFSLPQLLQLVSERSLAASGKTNLTMIMQLSGAITNIVLDPIFILVFDMGVDGAAIATIAGQVVSMVVGFLLNFFCNKEIKLKVKDLKPEIRPILDILKVGAPGILLQAIQSLQSLVFQFVFMILFSSNPATQDMLVGVYGVFFKLEYFIFMAFYGLINSLLPIIAYNYGNGQKKRCKEAMFYGALYGVILAVIGIVLFESAPEWLLTLFNLDEEWISTGVVLMRITAPTFVLASLCIVSTGILEGFGSGIHPLIVTALRLLIGLFPACLLFGMKLGINGIWWGSYIAESLGLIYGLISCIVTYKKSFRIFEAGALD